MENAGRPHRHAAVIVPVQMLRGAAASLVVAYHLLERLVRRGALPGGLPAWSDSGRIGVVTFFVISGFIMVHTTIGEFGAPGAGGRFLLRRIERILPLYWLTTLVMLVFAWATARYSTNGGYVAPTSDMVWLSAGFVPYIGFQGLAQPVYALGWTLEYEMFFYLVFAAALALPRRAGMVLAMVLLALLVSAGARLPDPPAVVGQVVAVFYFTRPIMLYFAAGMAIAWWRVARGPMALALPDWAIGLVASVMLMAAVRWQLLADGAVSAALVTGAVALATLTRAGRGQPAGLTWLSKRFGDVSYSIYLTHSFLLGALAAVGWRFAARGTGETAAVILVACVVCAVAAWPVWRLVERPVTRGLQRRTGASS